MSHCCVAGLAVRDFWEVDDSTIVFVADPTFGGILNFNVGANVDLQVPRVRFPPQLIANIVALGCTVLISLLASCGINPVLCCIAVFLVQAHGKVWQQVLLEG